jgi:hypothetical protein
MDFHLAFHPKALPEKVGLGHKIFLAGSCFTEQVGAKLVNHKFRCIDNPNGILFNPVSIANAISSYIDPRLYTADDLFYANELWGSWQHHTKFSYPNKQTTLDAINSSQQRAHDFLKSADWLMLTLGSAFAYEKEGEGIVANCHKVPTDKFTKRLLSEELIIDTLNATIDKVRKFNPGIKFIFTISPVRHLRDGFIENNRSKATLIQSVHRLVEMNESVYYFPAYELVIDDLRDYRFYAEDMVHPNYAATQYVFEKFVDSCVDEPSRNAMKEIAAIRSAFQHKPIHPSSQQHQRFLAIHLEKTMALMEKFPYLSWEEEIANFSKTSA